MPRIDVDGTAIYYEEHGAYEAQGAGEAILFAHGAGGNAAIWFEQVAAFAPRYRCITFDHRTFARSPADPATVSVAQFSRDALALLDALQVDRAHLVAQSMGGWTCLRLLLDHPQRVRSLTMSCTPGGLPNERPTDSMRNLTTTTGSSGAGVMRTMAKATAARPDRMLLYEAINAFNTGFSMSYLRSLGDPQTAVSFEDAGRIEAPVLFISGAEDPLFPSALLASYVPHFRNARFELIRDAGHSPYFEQPAVFNHLLAGFLEHGNG